MIKRRINFLWLALLLVSVTSQAQDNSRSVIRFVGCTIDDGFTFEQVVEKAEEYLESATKENSKDELYDEDFDPIRVSVR